MPRPSKVRPDPWPIRAVLGLGAWHVAPTWHGPQYIIRSTKVWTRPTITFNFISFGWPNTLPDQYPCVSPSMHHQARHQWSMDISKHMDHQPCLDNPLRTNMWSISSTSLKVPQSSNLEIHQTNETIFAKRRDGHPNPPLLFSLNLRINWISEIFRSLSCCGGNEVLLSVVLEVGFARGVLFFFFFFHCYEATFGAPLMGV